MFPTAESPFRAALRQFLDVAIEFATLGEYTLDGPAEPAATSPGPRSADAAVSPGARPERVAAAAGQSPLSEFDPARDPFPPELARIVDMQAAALARCAAGQQRHRGRAARTSAPAKRRPGTPKPVPQPCLTAGD